MFCTTVCVFAVLAMSGLTEQSPISVEESALCNDTDEMCLMKSQLRSVVEELGRLKQLEEDLDSRNPKKRKSSYVRFGKRSDEEEEEGSSVDKRKSSYVRFGKRDVLDVDGIEKRKSSYVRFGKRDNLDAPVSEVDKRKSSYVRFGRSGNEMQH